MVRRRRGDVAQRSQNNPKQKVNKSKSNFFHKHKRKQRANTLLLAPHSFNKFFWPEGKKELSEKGILLTFTLVVFLLHREKEKK